MNADFEVEMIGNGVRLLPIRKRKKKQSSDT
jgi:hypothetical protein